MAARRIAPAEPASISVPIRLTQSSWRYICNGGGRQGLGSAWELGAGEVEAGEQVRVIERAAGGGSRLSALRSTRVVGAIYRGYLLALLAHIGTSLVRGRRKKQ